MFKGDPGKCLSVLSNIQYGSGARRFSGGVYTKSLLNDDILGCGLRVGIRDPM